VGNFNWVNVEPVIMGNPPPSMAHRPLFPVKIEAEISIMVVKVLPTMMKVLSTKVGPIQDIGEGGH